MRELLIVGGGPAGLSAALSARQNGLDVGVWEATADLGGQLRRADHAVVDLLGQPGADGRAVIARWVAQVASIPIVRQRAVTSIARTHDGFSLASAEGPEERARVVVLATGTRARTLGWPGEARAARQPPAAWRGQRVLIIGGGDEAVSTAVELTRSDVAVTLVVRRTLAARAQFAAEARAHPGIDIVEGQTVVAVEGSRVTLSSGAVVDAVQVLTRIGVEVVAPAIDPAPARHEDGRWVIDGRFETTVPGLYAIGDCTAEGAARYASAAIAQGVRVARLIEERLRT